jgi:hypothetical protein
MVQTGTAVFVLALSLLSCSNGGANQVSHQESGTPDISAREAKRIPPFPPGHIVVKPAAQGFVVTWGTNALDPTLGYKIYRTDKNSTKAIGRVKGGTFIDKHPPTGDVAYAVSTVNQYDVESVPSKLVSAPK